MNRLVFAIAAITAVVNPWFGTLIDVGSVSHAGGPRPRKAAPPAPHPPDSPGLVIGEHRLIKIVDGDTIKVEGLHGSLRLLGIDTEETFKNDADRRAAAAGLGAYMTAKRGTSPRPVKFATPMGERAKQFAAEFFRGAERVRLERDHPAEILDRYDRYLAYVFVERSGAWINYNVACVRAGMAPYFPKYGNSRRFHGEFVAAEAAAKRERLGIWAPGAPGYTDYAEREAWWSARGAFVDAFRSEAEGKARHVDLTHADAAARLAALVGEPAVILGTVANVRAGDRGPVKVMLSRQRGDDFPLIFFDRGVLADTGITAWIGEFAIVTGVPRRYENKHDHRTQIEIVVDRASQIRLSRVPGLAPPRPTRVP